VEAVPSRRLLYQAAGLLPLGLAFEQGWLRGDAPRLEDYLSQLEAGAPPPVRAVLFRELLVLEIDYRRQRQETPTTAEYQRRFPEHSELILRLVCATPSGTDAAPRPDTPELSPSALDTSSVPGEAAPSTSREALTGAAPDAGTPLAVSDTVLARIPQGRRLTVLQVQGDWVWTSTEENGRRVEGWVPAENVILFARTVPTRGGHGD